MTSSTAVLRQVLASLRQGGRFVLDYLNADHVRRFSEEGKYVVKGIALGAENRSFEERVRLFSSAELRDLLEEEGFRVDAVFGDYDGGPLDARATRTILEATHPS